MGGQLGEERHTWKQAGDGWSALGGEAEGKAGVGWGLGGLELE